MIHIGVLVRVTIVGIVLQVLLAVSTPFVMLLAPHAVLFTGMMISATTGYIYAMITGKGYFTGATVGAISGGICAIVGVGAAVLFGHAPQNAIPFFTAVCVLTGAVGGIFGQLAAKLRAMGY